MIIPARAINPSNATKPNGRLARLRPSEAPDDPERRRQEHQDEPGNTLKLEHQQRQHDDHP